jgi:hypothetical protein
MLSSSAIDISAQTEQKQSLLSTFHTLKAARRLTTAGHGEKKGFPFSALARCHTKTKRELFANWLIHRDTGMQQQQQYSKSRVSTPAYQIYMRLIGHTTRSKKVSGILEINGNN